MWWHSCDLLLHHSRLFGLVLRPSRSCLSMPPGNLCHARVWHLRRKPCMEVLDVHFFPVAFSHLGSVFWLLGCHTASIGRRQPLLNTNGLREICFEGTVFHKISIYINCTSRCCLHLQRWNSIKNVKYGASPSLMIVPHGCYPNLSQTRVFGIRLSTLEHDGLLMRTRIPPFSEKTCWRSTLVTGSARSWPTSHLNKFSVVCHFVQQRFFEHHRDHVILMTEWVCRWKLFWIPTGDTFQRACLGEWQRVNDGQSRDFDEATTTIDLQSAESAKIQKTWSDDSDTKREQHCDAPSLQTFSWQTIGESDAPWWKFYGHSRKCCMLGTIGCTIAP